MQLVRKLLPWTTLALVIALLYTGYIFWNRSDYNRKQARMAAAKEHENAAKIIEMTGGATLKILSFYAMPAALHPGQELKICYGVANAAAVKIDPEVEPLKPVYNHCLFTHPRKTTHYTLTASDGKGHTETQAFDVLVQ